MKTKRLLAALMAFVMLFSLCSCGGKDGSDDKDSQNGGFAGSNAVKGYVGIEANNDEGRIIAAADRTLFGSTGLSVKVKEDGETFVDGSINFADVLATSGLSLKIGDGEIRIAAKDGKVYVVNDDEEYFTIDIEKVLAPSADEFDRLITEITGHSVDEWIGVLSKIGIEVDFQTVAGWVKALINGSINEDIIAEIFDTVAIPYFVHMAKMGGMDIEKSDIPDFKTLKEVIYDFFLDGHASAALDIVTVGNEYEITVSLKKFVESAIDYLEGHEKLQKLVNSEVGQYFLKEIKDELDYIGDSESFDFTVKINDGYISYVSFFDIEVTISDFNNVNTEDDYKVIADDADNYELLGEIENLDDIAAKM